MGLTIGLEKHLRNWEAFLQGHCNYYYTKYCTEEMHFLLLPDRLILQGPPGQFQMLPCPTCQIVQESKMNLHRKSECLAKALYWCSNRRKESY